jgi:serine/threonine-protein kinase
VIDPAWLAQQFPDLSGLTPVAGGGQKWVYRATHRRDGNVVLKVIKPGSDAERIKREILAVQRIASPRVPRILDTNLLVLPMGQFVWLREQLVPGRSVRAVIDSRVLSPEELRRLAEHALEALEAGERVRIVHRDVKPDNLMLDATGSFWLLDFGIARHLDLESATPTAQHYGVFTPGYAPPEQFNNLKREIDSRADLFALGVTLWECATRRNPFRDGIRDGLEVLRRVESISLDRVDRTDLDPALRDLIYSLTRPRADHRPSSAQDALAWVRALKITGRT